MSLRCIGTTAGSPTRLLPASMIVCSMAGLAASASNLNVNPDGKHRCTAHPSVQSGGNRRVACHVVQVGAGSSPHTKHNVERRFPLECALRAVAGVTRITCRHRHRPHTANAGTLPGAALTLLLAFSVSATTEGVTHCKDQTDLR
jgi:hypothetical protein